MSHALTQQAIKKQNGQMDKKVRDAWLDLYFSNYKVEPRGAGKTMNLEQKSQSSFSFESLYCAL